MATDLGLFTVLREDGGPVRDAAVTAFTGFGRVAVVPEEARTDVAGKALLQISGAGSPGDASHSTPSSPQNARPVRAQAPTPTIDMYSRR